MSLTSPVSSDDGTIAEQTTILVPIRYPLTNHSVRTLGAAGRIAQQHTPAEIRIFHANLYHKGKSIRAEELTKAISSTLDEITASVTSTQGFIVEQMILKEAKQINADIVVIGTTQKAVWRRLLSRLLGNEPDIGTFLGENLPGGIELLEVNSDLETPTAETS